MEKRAIFLSLGLSCFAMYLVWQYIDTKEAELEGLYGERSMTKLVVAAKDILQYQTIRPTDIAEITVPEAMRPPGQIFSATHVFDAVAAIPIRKGEFILDNKIISKNIYSGLDTQVAQDRRAISFPVNLKSGVGFHLRPGNRIDIASKFEYRARGVNTNELKVFMQDLLVLAVGRTIQPDAPAGVDQRILNAVSPDTSPETKKEMQETLKFAKTDANYETVTVEVTPEQAQILVYVMTVYRDLQVFLRNPNDRTTKRTATTNMRKVMGEDSYYVRHKILPPPRAIPQPEGYDFKGGRAVPFGK